MKALQQIWMFIPRKYQKKAILTIGIVMLIFVLIFLIGYTKGMAYGIDHCNQFWLNQTSSMCKMGSSSVTDMPQWN